MPHESPVDDYIAKQPQPQRATLERLRDQIRRLLPESEEVISYGFPAFKQGGKAVVWIAGWKAHCSIYPLTDAFLAEHAAELTGYESGKETLRFPADAPPPEALVDAMVRSRVADIEAGR
jgi:uncharacterized protein YdhG (YjbR/CyaY superfamily)